MTKAKKLAIAGVITAVLALGAAFYPEHAPVLGKIADAITSFVSAP